jgi:S-adenosylmethionine decarboxylase
MKNKRPLIEHKVIEIFEINSKTIWNCEAILPKIKKFSQEMGLNILEKKYHDFSPQGATLIFILSNSHLAVHTWPEEKYLHIDLVTCEKMLDNKKMIKLIEGIFKVSKKQINLLEVHYGKNKL